MAEMIQMLEGLNLRGLGAVPRPIRERFEPRRRPLPRRSYPLPGAREAGDGGPPLGELSDTVMTIVKFGALTAAAGGLFYVGSRLLHRRIRSRRRRG